MTVGEKIKQRRIELDMSQDELAKKCGYKSRSSIQKIEASRDLPLRKVKIMANVLDLSVSYLMGWDEFEYDSEIHTWNYSIEKKKNDSFDSFIESNSEYKELFETAKKINKENIGMAIKALKIFIEE